MKEKVEILLVEDEKIAREMLKIILEEEGYNVVAVEQGYEAMEKAKKKFFNIAMIDLKLPDMDGLEVLRKLKQISPDIFAVIITAYPSIKTTIEAIEEEASDYIIKPYEISQIEFVIRRGLEKQKLIMENKKLLESLEIEKGKLEHILQIGKTMSAILNVDELANFIIRKVTELIPAEKSSLMLIDKKTGGLVIKAAKGLDKNIIEKTKVKLGEAIAGMAAWQGAPILVKNIEEDVHFKRKKNSNYKSKSFLCLPLKIKDKVIGVLNITDKTSTLTDIFTEDDLKILSVIIHQASVAIENARLYEAVTCLSITDSVTGLFNHRYFHERLIQEINRVQRYHGMFSLIMLDIDSFKEYNDTYGHLYGDRALRDIAGILKSSARKVDLAARYGGEEFTIILPETNIQRAEILAKRIKQKVEEYSFIKGKGGPQAKLTVSIGVAEYAMDITKEELIERADKALYQAKREGRNRVCLFKS